MKAIVNARIYDYKNYIECGYVLFDKTIVEVGSMKDFKDNGYDQNYYKHWTLNHKKFLLCK